MCKYFYIVFIDFMVQGKSLLDYTNIFSPNKYEPEPLEVVYYYSEYLT